MIVANRSLGLQRADRCAMILDPAKGPKSRLPTMVKESQ
jgi:hypothetical protein